MPFLGPVKYRRRVRLIKCILLSAGPTRGELLAFVTENVRRHRAGVFVNVQWNPSYPRMSVALRFQRASRKATRTFDLN